MSNTVSAVLRLKNSVGVSNLIQCDGYTIRHRAFEVTLSFPRNEKKGVNDDQIITKIRSLAKIYYDQYGSSDSDRFIELFDDLFDYTYYLDNEEKENDDDVDPEEMMDYLEQQQDEEQMHRQMEEEDLPINITNYVEQMETLYGANLELEKNWLIHDEIKSAFPYQTTIYAVKSALDFMMVGYNFDSNTNIFTVYMNYKNMARYTSHKYQIIVRYATPFYSVVRFRRINISDCDMVHYNTQLTVVKQKVTFQFNGQIRI